MTNLQTFQSPTQLASVLNTQYAKQVNNYFGGDEKKALKFLSSVVAATQKTPELLTCKSETVLNSFMMMAQLELMPSDVSGEAYVLPYQTKYGKVAQFQLGYQGIVTLLYRAGARSITAEIVYEKDDFSFENGAISHKADPFSSDRGKAKGAYVIVELRDGGRVEKVMSKEEIMAIGEKFSKSFSTAFSPWNEKNDPQLWMWKKTVLKQAAKLMPKNEAVHRAIAEDNKDSIIEDRLKKAEKESESLQMGNLIKHHDDTKSKNEKAVKEDEQEYEAQESPEGTEPEVQVD